MRLSAKYSKLWVAAELLLFVLVGAAVDIPYAFKAGAAAAAVILGVLVFRMLGVLICLLGTELNRKEKLFCMFAYMPKATVQAARTVRFRWLWGLHAEILSHGGCAGNFDNGSQAHFLIDFTYKGFSADRIKRLP